MMKAMEGITDGCGDAQGWLHRAGSRAGSTGLAPQDWLHRAGSTELAPTV